MLARMWRKGNLLHYWWECKLYTLENRMEVPQEVKNRATLQPINIYPKDTNVVIRRGTCLPVFTAAMSTIAELWKEPGCPPRDEWIKKKCGLYTQWNSTQPSKHMKSCHLQLRGWN